MKIYLDEAVRQAEVKSGDRISVVQTFHNHARVHIVQNFTHTSTYVKDFVNLYAAFEWIIHAYNLREVVHEFYRNHRKVSRNKEYLEDMSEDIISKSTENISLAISHMTHYDLKDVDEVVDLFLDLSDNPKVNEKIKYEIFENVMKRIEFMIMENKNPTLRRSMEYFREKLNKKKWVI